MCLFFIAQITIKMIMGSRWNGIDKGKLKNSKRKPVPVTLCRPQIPLGLTWASAARGRRLTVWAMTRRTGGCRELHNEELHNLYTSTNIKTNMVWPIKLDWNGPDVEDSEHLWNLASFYQTTRHNIPEERYHYLNCIQEAGCSSLGRRTGHLDWSSLRFPEVSQP
jgi:hypothetical protein